jgi:hypothetical protein
MLVGADDSSSTLRPDRKWAEFIDREKPFGRSETPEDFQNVVHLLTVPWIVAGQNCANLSTSITCISDDPIKVVFADLNALSSQGNVKVFPSPTGAIEAMELGWGMQYRKNRVLNRRVVQLAIRRTLGRSTRKSRLVSSSHECLPQPSNGRFANTQRLSDVSICPRRSLGSLIREN